MSPPAPRKANWQRKRRAVLRAYVRAAGRYKRFMKMASHGTVQYAPWNSFSGGKCCSGRPSRMEEGGANRRAARSMR